MSEDLAVVAGMRHAHAQACNLLGVTSTPGHEAWGSRGRSLGKPVLAAGQTRWLRLVTARPGELADTFWNGNADAEHHLPSSIPRPRLLTWYDWTDDEIAHRAELFEYIATPALTPVSALDLPARWWVDLKGTLDAIAANGTERVGVHPGFLKWAMRHYLGIAAETDEVPWSVAHGDLRHANLTGPSLHLLDWEGWGLAPIGYDAATLHCHSLSTPVLAARIRRAFPILESPAGRHVELAVIAELLHYADNDTPRTATEQALLARAEELTRRKPRTQQMAPSTQRRAPPRNRR